MASSPKFIYKILPSAPPEPFPTALPFSSLDAQDGFVHLSTSHQVPQTADLFFNSHTNLWLIKIELSKLSDPLKWEEGFPHLYGNFGADDVNSVKAFIRVDGQSWADRMSQSDWLE